MLTVNYTKILEEKANINLKEEGEYIRASETIAEIADLSSVYVDFYVNAKDLSKYKLNQVLELKVIDKKYQGKIERINEEAEFTPKNVQTKSEKDNLVYGVRVRVENINEELKPGMQAEIL